MIGKNKNITRKQFEKKEKHKNTENTWQEKSGGL